MLHLLLLNFYWRTAFLFVLTEYLCKIFESVVFLLFIGRAHSQRGAPKTI